MNPELQLYVATEPTLLPLEKLIPPLAIPDKEPQVAIYDHKKVIISYATPILSIFVWK